MSKTTTNIEPLTTLFTTETEWEVLGAIQHAEDMLESGIRAEAIALYRLCVGLLAAPVHQSQEASEARGRAVLATVKLRSLIFT